MPARAFRLDNFTFSNLLLNEAHPSDMAISKPVGRRQEPPRQQPHLFLLDEAYPSDTAISKPVGRWREPTGQSNFSFPFCGRQKPTQPRCRLTARLSDHLTLPFCLNLSTRWAPISRRMPARALPARQPSLFKSTLVDANRPTRRSRNQSDESLPARQSFLFKSHARRGLPVRHGNNRNYRRTLARASQPDNLTFHVPRSARLTRPTRRLPKPTWTGASQPDNSSFPSARTTIRTPPNATHSTIKQPSLSVHHRRGSTTRPTSINLMSEVIRASRLDNLTFSSYVSEANPSNRWACPPVGCRLSIPTILYLSVFTCPTQWASISRRSPARAFPARQPCLF